MKPYFERNGITIYCADCRELLPELPADLVLTDPPYCEIAAKRLAQGVLNFSE